MKILVHIRGGIGDIIMSTPMIASFAEKGHNVSLYVDCGFKEVAPLFSDWNCLIKVSENPKDFEEDSFDVYFVNWIAWEPVRFKNIKDVKVIQCANSKLIWKIFDISEWYMNYARFVDPELRDIQTTYCGKSERVFPEITKNTVVVSPGCTREYPTKKWNKFKELIDSLNDVAVVGVDQDFYVDNSYIWPKWILTHFKHLLGYEGRGEKILKLFAKRYLNKWEVPSHAKNYVNKLSLQDTAALISQAGIVISNDSGLSHMAAALGVKTIIIFGPTMDEGLFPPKENVVILKKNLACQPCIKRDRYFDLNIMKCENNMMCMKLIEVRDVLNAIDGLKKE